MTQMFAVPYLPPLDWESLLAWLRVRALPGVELATGDAYATAVMLPGGAAVLRMTHDLTRSCVEVEAQRAEGPNLDERDLVVARAVVVRMLDLDAEPDLIDAHLATVPLLSDLVLQAPGMRIPGEPTPLLALIRALTGQQVSVAGGLAQIYRLVGACAGARGAAHMPPETDAAMPVLVPFPDAEAILEAGFDWYRGPAARRQTIRAAVELAASGGLDVSRETETIAHDLLALKGVGPWTVAYTLMRGYGEADADLSGDRALINAARTLSDVPLAEILDAARPYRSYAALYLWRSAGS